MRYTETDRVKYNDPTFAAIVRKHGGESVSAATGGARIDLPGPANEARDRALENDLADAGIVPWAEGCHHCGKVAQRAAGRTNVYPDDGTWWHCSEHGYFRHP